MSSANAAFDLEVHANGIARCAGVLRSVCCISVAHRVKRFKPFVAIYSATERRSAPALRYFAKSQSL